MDYTIKGIRASIVGLFSLAQKHFCLNQNTLFCLDQSGNGKIRSEF